MPTDRRTFLKGALALPLVPVAGSFAAPALKSTNSLICTGQWNDLPVGCARYTDFQINAPPWPEVEPPDMRGVSGSLWPSVTELLTARLEPAQVAHATGHCSCASDDDIERRNRDWWVSKEMVSIINGVQRRWWWPHEFSLCDCEDDSEMCHDYCEWGMLRHPDEYPRPNGAG